MLFTILFWVVIVLVLILIYIFILILISFWIKGSATDIAWTLRDSISSGPPCLAFAVGSLDGTVLFVQLGKKRIGEEKRGEE